MSSLNKAFIQVYKKNPKSSDRVNGPHFTIESESKPESQSGKVAPSASASTEGTVHFFRIDPPSDVASQPWLMSSVSTLGIDEYIAHSNQAPAATKPETKIKPRTDSNKSESVAIPSARIDSFSNDLPVAPWQDAAPVQPIVVKTSMAAPILRTEEESRLDQDFYSNWVSATPTATKDVSAKSFSAKETVLPQATSPEPAPAVIYHAPPATVREESPQESPLPFQAVWEVDAFQWPSVIHDLHRRDPSILVEVGKHLRNACRTGLKVIAVTSEGPEQGRTTVALCMARAAAKSGLTVALMDADLHHPELADKLNLEMAHGWEEAVATQLPLEETAIHSIEDRITLIPLTCRPNPLQLAPDHPKVQNILRRLSQSFDLVVIDSQHLSHPASRLVGGGIDTPIHAAVLVVDPSPNNEPLIQDCVRRLGRQGIDSVGLVENFQ